MNKVLEYSIWGAVLLVMFLLSVGDGWRRIPALWILPFLPWWAGLYLYHRNMRRAGIALMASTVPIVGLVTLYLNGLFG